MKTGVVQVQATAVLQLTERELLILNHICSYDLSKDVAKVSSYTPTELGNSITREEMQETVRNLRTVTSALIKHIDDTKLFSQAKNGL